MKCGQLSSAVCWSSGRRCPKKSRWMGGWLHALRSRILRPGAENLADPRQPVRHEVVTHVLGTICHPSLRSGQLVVGDPGRNRTCDLQLRRLLLYPLSYGAKPGRSCNSAFAAVRKTKSRAQSMRLPGFCQWPPGDSTGIMAAAVPQSRSGRSGASRRRSRTPGMSRWLQGIPGPLHPHKFSVNFCSRYTNCQE